MQKTLMMFILMGFLMAGAGLAAAEESSRSDAEQAGAVPANMDDEALASYIAGRLNLLLKDEGYKVTQTCDASGCSVSVQ